MYIVIDQVGLINVFTKKVSTSPDNFAQSHGLDYFNVLSTLVVLTMYDKK